MAHSSEIQSIMARKSQQQEREAAGHAASAVRKQKCLGYSAY